MTELKIHKIIQEAIHSSEIEDEDYENLDSFVCVGLVEVEGEMSEEELHFADLDDYYEIYKHLQVNIEPYVVEMEKVGDHG